MRYLGDEVWPDIGKRPLVLVPVGSIEQHGPHLPLDTDTAIAVAVAEGVAARCAGEVVLAPPVTYGSSGEHQSFAGTVSIGSEVLRAVLIELVRSLSTWAGRIVFVNAHGGNTSSLAKATFQMITEGHDVAWVPCASEDSGHLSPTGADLHAGLTETSLMLHIRPAAVRLELAEVGETRRLSDILPLMMAGGIAAVSPSGVLGDPTGASATHGETVLEAMISDALDRLGHGALGVRGVLGVHSPTSVP